MTGSIFKKAYALYESGDYQRAIDLLEGSVNALGGRLGRYHFWRMCLYALLGNPESVILILKDALNEGYVYSEEMLRGDTDLESMKGNEEYERLVQISQAAFEIEADETKPAISFLDPPLIDGMNRLIFALHAYASNMREASYDWTGALELGYMLCLPQSRQLHATDSYKWNDYEAAKTQLLDQWMEVKAEHNLSDTDIIPAGLSQGAATVTRLLLDGSIESQGAILVAPAFKPGEKWDPILASAVRTDARFFIVIGEEDWLFEDVMAFSAAMRDTGIPLHIETFKDVGHEFPSDFTPILSRALAFIEADTD